VVDLPHHVDSSDLPGHGNSGDRRSGAAWAGRRQIVLATNHNDGMRRLNASCHDDDDYDENTNYTQKYC